MSKIITLELPERVEFALAEATHEEGLSQSEIVAAALDDYLFIRRFRQLRKKMMSLGKREYTEQEVFESVS